MNQAVTIDLPSVTNFNRSLAASLAAHVLVLGTAFWGASGSSDTPLGAKRLGDSSLIEVGLVTPQATTAKLSIAKNRQSVLAVDDHDAVIKKNREIKEDKTTIARSDREQNGSADPARFGLKEGTIADGRMGVDNGFRASERERYLYELRVLLEGRKIYPKISRHMGEAGKVTIRFIIRQDGGIDLVEVVKASSFARLNQAASDLVSGLKKYKPLPEGVESASMQVEVPIEFVLN